MTTATLDFDQVDTDHTFTACVLCGGSLNSYGEQHDGICYGCDPDAPALLLPTDTGRAVLHYTDAQDAFCHELSESEDEDRVPDWEAPNVVKARRRMKATANVLALVSLGVYAPCGDCDQIDCCCP